MTPSPLFGFRRGELIQPFSLRQPDEFSDLWRFMLRNIGAARRPESDSLASDGKRDDNLRRPSSGARKFDSLRRMWCVCDARLTRLPSRRRKGIRKWHIQHDSVLHSPKRGIAHSLFADRLVSCFRLQGHDNLAHSIPELTSQNPEQPHPRSNALQLKSTSRPDTEMSPLPLHNRQMIGRRMAWGIDTLIIIGSK